MWCSANAEREALQIVGLVSCISLLSRPAADRRFYGLCKPGGTGDRRARFLNPTGSGLNVRTNPNGQIVGTFRNGTLVSVLVRTLDSRGRPWVYVRTYESGAPRGWVFGNYLDCNSNPT